MATTKYEDGRCEYTNDGEDSVILYRTDMLEISNTHGDELETAFMFIPDWLADAIREAFIKKIEEEKDKSA